jgi:hypothetical protein
MIIEELDEVRARALCSVDRMPGDNHTWEEIHQELRDMFLAHARAIREADERAGLSTEALLAVLNGKAVVVPKEDTLLVTYESLGIAGGWVPPSHPLHPDHPNHGMRQVPIGVVEALAAWIENPSEDTACLLRLYGEALAASNAMVGKFGRCQAQGQGRKGGGASGGAGRGGHRDDSLSGRGGGWAADERVMPEGRVYRMGLSGW